MKQPWYKRLLCRHDYKLTNIIGETDVCSCGCGTINEVNYELYKCTKCRKIKRVEVNS